MNLWETYRICNQSSSHNARITFHYDHGIDQELKKKYVRFARWLRKNYTFPVRLHVYILNEEKVSLKSGKRVYGKFCWYPKRNPNIKIPSAIEKEALEEYTLEEIYDQILSSLVHEITHYYQWAKGLEQSNAVSERQANFYRYRIIDEYYKTSR